MGLDFALINQHPITLHNDSFLLSPNSGVKVGYSFMDGQGTISNVMYFGISVGYLFPHTNTFTAYSDRYYSVVPITGTRKSSFYSIALRMSFPLNFASTEFLKVYYGIDAGFMGGSSFYSYDTTDPAIRIKPGYPVGKYKYRNFLINPYLGLNYEFEKFSVCIQAGYRIASLTDFIGDESGALTFEAGLHYPIKLF